MIEFEDRIRSSNYARTFQRRFLSPKISSKIYLNDLKCLRILADLLDKVRHSSIDILETLKDRNHATTLGTQRSLQSSLELEQHIKGHGVVMDFFHHRWGMIFEKLKSARYISTAIRESMKDRNHEGPFESNIH